jgi:hypothetical protein
MISSATRKNFFSEQPFPCLRHLKVKMKKNIFIFSVVSLVSCAAMAQKQDSIPVRSLAEKAAQGDIILGQESKKQQLQAAPPMLNAVDSFQKRVIQRQKASGKLK